MSNVCDAFDGRRSGVNVASLVDVFEQIDEIKRSSIPAAEGSRPELRESDDRGKDG